MATPVIGVYADSYGPYVSTGPGPGPSAKVLVPTGADYSHNVFEDTDFQSVHADLGIDTVDSYFDAEIVTTRDPITPDPYGIGLYQGETLVKFYASTSAGSKAVRISLPPIVVDAPFRLRLGVQEGSDDDSGALGYTTIKRLTFPTDANASFRKFANEDDVLVVSHDSIGASVFASNLDKHWNALLRRKRRKMTIYCTGWGYKFLSRSLNTPEKRAKEIQRVLKAWGNAKKRRYVLALGTNDATNGVDASLAMSYAQAMLKELLAAAPDAMLYVQLVFDYGTYTSKEYRKAALALQKDELANLRFLDPGLPQLKDELHPDDVGYGQVADRHDAQLDLPPTDVPKPPTRPASNFTDADFAPMFYSDSLNGYVVKPHEDGTPYTEQYTVAGLTTKRFAAGQDCSIIFRAQYKLGNVVIGVRKVAQVPSKFEDIDYALLIGDQDQKLYTSLLGNLQPVRVIADGEYVKLRRAADGKFSLSTSTDGTTYTALTGTAYDNLSDAADLDICFVAQDNGTAALIAPDCFNCATR